MRRNDLNDVLTARRSMWKQVAGLVSLGSLGVMSLLFQPVNEQLLSQHPDFAEMPVLWFKLLTMLNPLVLLIVASLLGALVAHRVGLRSLVAGTAWPFDTNHAWVQAAVAGMLTGALVALLDVLAAPWLGEAWQHYLRQAARPDAHSLLIGVLYGGVTEEILMRWGVMSLLAWGVWTLAGKRQKGLAIVFAIFAVALVFGMAHLPVLAAQMELSTGIVTRTVLLNAFAGLVYGWVFWRHHLEAAMLSHACSHLAMGMVWALV